MAMILLAQHYVTREACQGSLVVEGGGTCDYAFDENCKVKHVKQFVYTQEGIPMQDQHMEWRLHLWHCDHWSL